MSFKEIIKMSILSMAVILLVNGNVFGGATARNISVQSANSYLVGGARWAETDAGDTPLHNPAGTAFMTDGIHTHSSTLITDLMWNVKDLSTGKEYLSGGDIGFIPCFAQTYKKNNWAVFITAGFPGGNGSGQWEPVPYFDYAAKLYSTALGTAVTAKDQKFEYAGGKMALTVGGGYKINDNISVGYGIRQVTAIGYVDANTRLVVEATGQTIGELTLKQEMTGNAIGHMFSMIIKPNDKLTIGLRYDPMVSLFQYNDVDDDDNSGAVDMEESENSLPAIFFAGAEYQLTPKLTIDTGFVYAWNKGINGDDEPLTQKWENGYELQLGLEYRYSQKWLVLSGINFSHVGIPNEAYTLESVSYADAFTLSAGVVYTTLGSNLDILLGAGISPYPWNPKTEAEPIGIYERRTDKPVTQMFLGLEYRL